MGTKSSTSERPKAVSAKPAAAKYSQQSKLLAQQKNLAAIEAKLKLAAQQLKENQKKLSPKNKAAEQFMAQSDSALEQTTLLKKKASAARDKTAKKAFLEKAKSAQLLANSKAHSLVVARQEFNLMTAENMQLRSTIKNLEIQKANREKLIAAKMEHLNKLKHGNDNQIASKAASSAGKTYLAKASGKKKSIANRRNRDQM